MASLNTLRTRFGVVLSIIIAFALLAFILSLKTDMGLSGNDPKVGVIDGSKIRYSEYIEVYNNLKDQSNISESNEEQMDQLAEMAWQTLIANHVYLPGFEKMGISVTDAEREGLISGEYYSGTMAAAFTDPRTGQYSVEGVSDFIAQATGNPQMQYMWGLWSDRLCGSAKSISITAWSKAVYMSIGWKRKKASMRRIRLSAVLGSASVITICLILCSRFPIPKSRLITIAIRPVMSRNLRARSLMWCSKWLRVQRIWRLWRRPFGKSAMNLPRRTIRKHLPRITVSVKLQTIIGRLPSFWTMRPKRWPTASSMVPS